MNSKRSGSRLLGAVGFVSKAINMVGMIVLVAMMLLTVADVFLRYFFNSPIMGGTEITEYMMVFLFLGVPWCIFNGRAIKMDLIVAKFPKNIQALLDGFTDTLGLVVMIFLTWQLFKEMKNADELGIASNVLGIPSAPSYGVLAVAVGVLCLVLAANILRNLVKGVKG